MRRLPVYILIDTSGSMKGEPIESVKVGLEAMIRSLRQDPYALETAWISIITFDREVRCLLPLTPLEDLQLPEIVTPDSGPTHTGAALKMLRERIDSEVRRSRPGEKGDWMPLVFLLTDGKPSDIQEFNQQARLISRMRLGRFVACAAGMSAKTEPLKMLTPDVYQLDSLDANGFRQFFRWVSASIGVGNRSVGSDTDLVLPPPPEEVNLVI